MSRRRYENYDIYNNVAPSSEEVDPSSTGAERGSRFTMIERHISSGKSSLRKFLQSRRSSLSKAPILIISSGAGVDETSVPSVDHACRKTQFLTSMEMGLKTVQSTVSSAFPTTSQVQTQIDLFTRTGAKTILGVGSGAAIDLVKTLLQKGYGRGILVPSTYGAIIASTSSHSILLDTTEEALVVLDNSLESDNTCTTVIIETDELARTHGKDSAWACLAIGMDSLYRRPYNDQGKILLQQGLDALKDESHLSEALVSAGKALDYGLNDHLRSAPLALATSLIPPCFPSASVMKMFASLLPGILQVSSGTSNLETQVRDAFQDSTSDVPSLAALVVHSDAAQPVPILLSHVRSNQALCKCLDVDDDILEAILHYSLNR